MSINKAIKVIKVIDEFQLVLNVGSIDGITDNHRFLVYELGEEFQDPETGEILGRLEIVKGTGIVSHLQEKMCTICSDKINKTIAQKIITESTPQSILGFGTRKTTESIPEEEKIPFSNPNINDYARIIESYIKK